MNINESVSNVKGVGDKTIPKLNKLNIYTIGDLIYDLPRGFMELHEPVNDLSDHIGDIIAVKGYIKKGSVRTIKKGRTMTFASLVYSGGEVSIVYFNAPYISKALNIPEERIFYGVLNNNRGLSISQPKIYSVLEYTKMLCELQPVYGLTKGISNVQMRKYIGNALDIASLPDEYLTADELNSLSMPPIGNALRGVHFSENMEDYLSARRRLVFHEFLTFFMETQADELTVKRPFGQDMIPVADTGRLIESLPYKLTNAQLRTWKEIEEDMCSGICMNRMVQGDVGSGKTIIAFLALLLNAANGHQGCLMAPTEVLATQHYEALTGMIKKYNLPIRPRLLTGSLTAKAKRDIYEGISTGFVNVIIGTHAVIQDAVSYYDLTLAITDEQHRFGVKQREALAACSSDVHVLVMSATPIPRSLAMTMFSGVSLSVIDEFPANRLPIKNCVISPSSRPAAYKFIADEVKKDHQVYVICPLVEETEGMNLENVIDYADKLKSVLPSSVRIDYLHGKMRIGAKNKIMEDFADHNIDVLVSTTVIEVGINVPNSTVMLVENADRFGLASLHQLRGRVGRGDAQSYCIFINSGRTEWTQKRLEILNSSNDGFFIAEEDLKMRGPGQMQGIAQSGDFGFVIANIYDDAPILYEAKKYFDRLSDNTQSSRMKEITDAIRDIGLNPVDFKTI